MIKKILFLSLFLSNTILLFAQKTAPIAPILPKTDTIHGQIITDPYSGIRSKSPDVMRYLQQENRYTLQAMKGSKKTQKEIAKELYGYIPPADTSLPYFDNGYWYYDYYKKGSEYPIYVRKKGTLAATEEVVLDEAALVKSLKAYSISDFSISLDNEWLAYFVDYTGNFETTVLFRDLTDKGRANKDVLKRVTGLVWTKDPNYIYYSCQDSIMNRSYRVYRHKMGTAQSADELLFEEKDETYSLSIYPSKSKEYIFISSESLAENEVWFAPNNPTKLYLRCFAPRSPKHIYRTEHVGGHFYIMSDWAQAYNNQVYITDTAAYQQKNWEMLIEHRFDVHLTNWDVFNQHLALVENAGGNYQIRVLELKTGNNDIVKIPHTKESESGYIIIGATSEMDADSLRFGYTSLRMPLSYYSYQFKTKETKQTWQRKIPNYNPDNYKTERIWAVAADGEKIPITLLYKKDLDTTVLHPCLLEAYGSYGAGSPPYFYRGALPLVNRDWVYGIAHVRGGDDMGRDWYEKGKLLHKKNTFTDFIACTEHLIKEGYTSAAQMTATGASAGGLLMGAIVNQRPDLYKAVLLGVPFVDVMNTMLDPSLPLTTLEYNEWGNPNDKIYYDYMLSYSPYENVKAQNYPNMLFSTGIADEQVGFWEPTKMVAKLRTIKTDTNLLLLRVNMGAGHAGTPGRYGAMAEMAFDWAFLIKSVEGK